MKDNTTHSFLNIDIFSKLIRYIKPYNKTFISILFAAIFLSFLGILRPWLLKLTVDDYILTKNYNGLLNYSILMGGVLIIEVVLRYLFSYYANWIGQSMIRDIRNKIFKLMLSFKMKYYDKSSVGILVTRTVNDIERIGDVFGQGFFEIISDVLKMLVVVVLMFYTSWKLSLVVLLVLPFVLYATKIFQKSMKIAFNEVRTQISNLNAFVQERLSGMTLVQVFNREKEDLQEFKKINQLHKKAWLKTVWYNSIFFPITELSTSITIGLIVWYGSAGVVSNSGLEIGVIFMFIQLSQMLFRPLHQIADKFNTLQMGTTAAYRVLNILNTESTTTDNGTITGKKIKGKIEFKNVNFSYLQDEAVLKDLNFTIQSGEMIALVGSTGSGKSTIINLINRFYDIEKGDIFIDDKKIDDYVLKSLRASIAVVLQDTFLFADSILNNITLRNPNISRDQVYQAAKEIGFYDFIMSLPNGFDFNVKERGNSLSVGQKQLITFLRAYVSKPNILILDEATSSIDTYSEQLIQNAIDKIIEGQTSIVVAHRLATIQKADRIMVLDKGKLVETGSHKELLNIENGYYKKLYDYQFKDSSLGLTA